MTMYDAVKLKYINLLLCVTFHIIHHWNDCYQSKLHIRIEQDNSVLVSNKHV